MAHIDERVVRREPGLESRLDLLARLVVPGAVLLALRFVYLAIEVDLGGWDTLAGIASTLFWGAVLHVALRFAGEYLRLRRHELGFAFDGSLEREPVAEFVCSACQARVEVYDRGCRACNARFDPVDGSGERDDAPADSDPR